MGRRGIVKPTRYAPDPKAISLDAPKTSVDVVQKQIDEVLHNLSAAIVAIRSTGGYKFRQQIKLSDEKIEKWVDHAIRALQEMTVNLLIAEMFLQKKQPSILAYIFRKVNRQPPWGRYRQVSGRYLAVLRKKK